MSDLRPATSDHMHVRDMRTGMPRFHFDVDSDAAAAAAAAAAGGGAKPWHDGVEAETLGFWQNKGYDVTSPVKVASELTKQYRAAEKYLGVPADQVIKLPKADAKPEEWAAVHQRLGAPAKAEEYDFSAVKNAAGEIIAQPLADTLRAAAFSRGLSKDAAVDVAKAVVKHIDDTASSQKTIRDGKVGEEKAALAKNWGPKFDFNRLTAMEGARRAGISPEGVEAMEGQVGYAAVMEHFRRIGANTTEATFHEGGGGGPVNTQQGALARLTELEADKAWGKRLSAGDATATAEWRQLTALANGEAA